MAGAAIQAGDADSSRLTSGLQGSVNVHLGALWCHGDSASVLSYFTFIHIVQCITYYTISLEMGTLWSICEMLIEPLIPVTYTEQQKKRPAYIFLSYLKLKYQKIYF